MLGELHKLKFNIFKMENFAGGLRSTSISLIICVYKGVMWSISVNQ